MQRQFDDVLLGSIELFCLAAEAGSFTAAANAAGVTPAGMGWAGPMVERLTAHTGALHSRPRPASVDSMVRIFMITLSGPENARRW